MRTADNKWLPIATLIYLISLCLIQLLLVMDGARVPYYAIIAAASILPALYKSRTRRIWSVIATLIVLALLIRDHYAGVRVQRVLLETLRSAPMQQHEEIGDSVEKGDGRS